ncbi:MAG: DUF4381 family protein [Verrucomicrobiae bacterium]|nr:DUF4381 family protein [Verrucomicrobiae bacterium]
MASPASPPPPAPDSPSLADGLRDIAGPVPVGSVWDWILWGLVTALLLGAVAAALYLWWRARQRRLNRKEPEPPPLPAHVRARQALDRALALLSDPDRFCTEVSRILRGYLEERFGWNAPDRTTEEFLAEMGGAAELPESHRELLADFLTRCDLVKFARHDPTEGELRGLHSAAIRLVEDTVPPPPPVGGVPAELARLKA